MKATRKQLFGRTDAVQNWYRTSTSCTKLIRAVVLLRHAEAKDFTQRARGRNAEDTVETEVKGARLKKQAAAATSTAISNATANQRQRLPGSVNLNRPLQSQRRIQ